MASDSRPDVDLTSTRPARVRVAVIFGGRSSEHAISCISAGSIMAALDPDHYDVVPVGITRSGQWVLAQSDAAHLAITDGRLPEVAPVLHRREIGAGEAAEAGDRGLPAVLTGVDVVFPVLHGPWGEDGTMQGLLDLAGIPYVGSGVFASAAAMDKGHMRALLAAAGIAQTPYEVITDRQWVTDSVAVLERVRRLGVPAFVKPARAGSSIGITRVTEPGDLAHAIEHARQHDRRVIVEAGVEGGREIECGVLEFADGPRASECAEIVVKGGHDFYDFEAKYLDDAVDLVVPADLAPEHADAIRALSTRAFEVLGCEGLARCDVFVTASNEILLNEVNTMPGFTPISMFPRMWQASGLGYPALVAHLVQDALRRGTGLR